MLKLNMMAGCTPSTWEVEVRRSKVHDQPGLPRETLFQNTNPKKLFLFEETFCISIKSFIELIPAGKRWAPAFTGSGQITFKAAWAFKMA